MTCCHNSWALQTIQFCIQQIERKAEGCMFSSSSQFQWLVKVIGTRSHCSITLHVYVSFQFAQHQHTSALLRQHARQSASRQTGRKQFVTIKITQTIRCGCLQNLLQQRRDIEIFLDLKPLNRLSANQKTVKTSV